MFELMNKLFLQIFCLIFVFCPSAFAVTPSAQNDVVEKRIALEQAGNDNSFIVSFYKPTYFLPAYYTTKPDTQIYDANQETVKNLDFKFQFSFKVPLARQLFGYRSAIYLAYTQLSYWQAYAKSPFFRESNYEPEIFVTNKLDLPGVFGWHAKLLDFGLVHQSNGRGGDMERSWNRIYTSLVLARNNLAVSLRPWYIIDDSSYRMHNHDIYKYLGYGEMIIAYKFHENTFALQTRNILDSGLQRGSEQFTWSFPMITHLRGYVQLFSGYGQSLIEYNHYTNSAGIGVALNDWI